MHQSMSSSSPRKRPAPGASPVAMQPMHQPQAPMPPQWSGGVADTTNFVDPSRNLNPYLVNAQYEPALQQPPATVAPLQPSRALVPTGPRGSAWSPTFGGDGAMVQQPGRGPEEHDNIDQLERMALEAKQEAEAKRKQIPPFVQKLSSFLEQRKNTELIRWSEKGDSFFVLDEDEFAKTMIPELFKHSNYASFVRQLNMYGFHKRVGLSDNSMKASERKTKNPSEYANPFFRRGHPNLLWLISKTKSGTKKKVKKEDGDADSDEEAGHDETLSHTQPPRSLPAASGEVGPLQKKDIQQVRHDVETLKNQQRYIHEHLHKLGVANRQLYSQALKAQELYNQHETQIQSILRFLASLFNRSPIGENAGAQSLANFVSALASQIRVPPAQGNVVNLDHDVAQPRPTAEMPVSPIRRTQRLLPPIPQYDTGAASASPASNASPTPQFNGRTQPGQMGSVTELLDTPTDTSSPNFLVQELQNTPGEDIMKMIQDVSAAGSINANSPAMPVRSPVGRGTQQPKAAPNFTSQQPPAPPTAATVSPTPPPTMPAPGGSPSSLSPIMSHIQQPFINDLALHDRQIEDLERLQQDQNSKINHLSQLLAPLSPSGKIPGVFDKDGNGVGGYFDGGLDKDAQIDFDKYLTQDAYDANDFVYGDGVSNGSDFDFNLDTTAFDSNPTSLPAERIIETRSDSNTPSPAATEEIPRNDLDRSPMPDAKRRRVA